MMNTKRRIWMAATTAFAGGFLSGMLLAPGSGLRLRDAVAGKMAAPRSWAESQARAVEARLTALEAQSRELAERLRVTTSETFEHYAPALGEGAWSVDAGDLARDLRLPGR